MSEADGLLEPSKILVVFYFLAWIENPGIYFFLIIDSKCLCFGYVS